MAHVEEKTTLHQSEKDPSLLKMVERWLERTPFLKFNDFDFLAVYHQTINRMLANDEAIIRNNPSLTEKGKEVQLQMLAASRENFEALFDEKKHNTLLKEGRRRISYKATHAALLIMLYRDQPILHLPFQLLNYLIDIDKLLTSWRQRHALMVQRMIGWKIGTGGSLGHEYLKTTVEKHVLFTDFTNLATFMIPRSALPPLPSSLEKSLGFHYGQ
jgi:tryptophan 2,3-dioxygenase